MEQPDTSLGQPNSFAGQQSVDLIATNDSPASVATFRWKVYHNVNENNERVPFVQ